MGSDRDDYDNWTKEMLIGRLKNLEAEVKRFTATGRKGTGTQGPSSKRRVISNATRFIALKLAYLGKNYGGFEYGADANKPTVEEELWKAMVRTRLIQPENPNRVNFAPFEYSKCGRTDRGVSAFGQVIALRVRSTRSEPVVDGEGAGAQAVPEHAASDEDARVKWTETKPAREEMNYCRILNDVLPHDIRILAWVPDPPPGFSARGSCRERQYRYFFTQPAFCPRPSKEAPGTRKPGWLDIEAMRKAAKTFEGLHDFRNFCKMDPSKQVTSFTRRVFESDIVHVKNAGSSLSFLDQGEFRTAESVDEGYPETYYFHIRASAFLWHQIRHMVNILFAVGQGLEKPSVVAELLDVETNPARPEYNMADEIPLVLWDCIFPDMGEVQNMDDTGRPADSDMKDGLNWEWVGEKNAVELFRVKGLVDVLWTQWRERKMDELLASRLLDHVTGRFAEQFIEAASEADQNKSGKKAARKRQPIFEGGNRGWYSTWNVPLMKRSRLARPDEVNDKWAQKFGFANGDELRRQGNWRAVVKAARDAKRAERGGEDDVAVGREVEVEADGYEDE